MGLVLIWLVLAIFVGLIASNIGRNGVWWFLIACVVSPLLGLIALLIVGKRAIPPPPLPPARHEATKTCPRCAEHVKFHAEVCRYCGADVSGVKIPDAPKLT